MWQDTVSGTKKCAPPQTPEQVAAQIWTCYKAGIKCEVCEADFSKIAAAITSKYAGCLQKRPDITDGGMCLAKKVDPTALKPGECLSIGVQGVRTYADGTTSPFLHAVMLCNEGGKLVVYDNNDPTAGGVPVTVGKNGSITWTVKYNKPPKPVGNATQSGSAVDVQTIIKCLDP